MLQTVLFMVVLGVAFTVQAITGLGGPLIAMPLGIALVGVETAKPVITLLGWATALFTTIPIVRHINVRELLKITGVMLAFVLAGLWLFDSLNMDFLLVFYGIIIILIGARRLFFPTDRKMPGWLKWVFLCAAGLMQGMFVSGGSFLTVYAASQLEEKQTFRATVSCVWVILNIFMIVSNLRDGSFTPPVVSTVLWGIIPTVAATVLGTLIAKKLNRDTFIKLTYVILLICGTVLLISNI